VTADSKGPRRTVAVDRKMGGGKTGILSKDSGCSMERTSRKSRRCPKRGKLPGKKASSTRRSRATTSTPHSPYEEQRASKEN